VAWGFDAPLGVYRNHELSMKIREQAAADSMVMKFMTPEPGYGRKKGAGITITRVYQLPLAGRVSETEMLPSGRPAIDTKTVTVSEWGFQVELTEFEENLTHFDLRNKFQRMLRDQMRLTQDTGAAIALKATPLRFTPHVTAGVDDSAISTGGTFNSVVANRNLGVVHLRQLRDYLKGTLKCPEFRNGNYIGILSTKCARGIKNDPEYKDWLAPSTDEPLITGAMKSIEGFDLYETNNFNAIANQSGSANANTSCGEALFFGDDHAFTALVQDPEIRAGIPTDLGRFRNVGWVGTFDFGLTWDVAATGRTIYLGSTT